ncbi:MAG: phosphoribosylaminoimidazolesuccinocarboxamide synthase [Oscillospiraceae bacterium]|jgi:phosphoribosylaminoimidazole-succinocarboxamide synthase|nr:phosphoribosylaminoimidazolesuccinocarboxamide synthase [Oscillospiraceae bacterium]
MLKPLFSGKVRDIYDVSDDTLVIVTTDRISAYDVVLPAPVPGKGAALNQISNFWFDRTRHIIQNHVISADERDMPEFFRREEFKGRAVLSRKLDILPFEFIVRGYIFGSMWAAYTAQKPFCGKLISGEYKQAQKLAEPILTPAAKAAPGEHDEYIGIDAVKAEIGEALTAKIAEVSLQLYAECREYALSRGIIIADTKFEFGLSKTGDLVLADEIFTPDSSRFWKLDDYEVGASPRSYDKQPLRDWLDAHKLNGEYQFAAVPPELLEQTARIYEECRRRLVEA